MTLIAMLVLLGVIAFGAAVGPPMYKAKKISDRNKFLHKMITSGTPEQKERAHQICEREENLKLKLLEYEQASEVLDTPGIRRRLEDANVDVEELKRLLSGCTDDEILREYKLLEQKAEERYED